ncbi:DUF6665 family protein [Phenylobacterium sp.]|jgi:hypothetical protein|uniref:DUF6665 family protein n=1 Tax=Phenylobacterium sp. TaxID=1871053 RepID=UPI002F95785D
MSPLHAPRTLAEPQHVDSGEAVLKFELLEELDAAVSRCEHQVEAALDALQAWDGPAAGRAALLDWAADAVWRLVVQHEACDCADHQALLERLHVPPQVMARIGARH